MKIIYRQTDQSLNETTHFCWMLSAVQSIQQSEETQDQGLPARNAIKAALKIRPLSPVLLEKLVDDVPEVVLVVSPVDSEHFGIGSHASSESFAIVPSTPMLMQAPPVLGWKAAPPLLLLHTTLLVATSQE
jgi:hypothetical protein